jgi:hypothetical protein
MANRFDEILPIQPVLYQSLYTPFRMKDNTDLYTKLLATLATKKEKDIKPDAVPIAERHKPILPIQYRTNTVTLPNSEVGKAPDITFNIDYSTPYNYVEGVLWNNINNKVNQLMNYLASDNVDKDEATLAVLDYKRDVAGYKNNQILERFRIMNENAQKLTQNLKHEPEKNLPTYRKLGEMEFLSKNFMDSPLESQIDPSGKTFGEALKEYSSAVKEHGLTTESALKRIYEAVSDKYFTQIFQTTKTIKDGSSFNSYIDGLKELEPLKSSATNLVNLHLMANLKNIQATNNLQNSYLKYTNLYDLHLVLERPDLFKSTSFETIKAIYGDKSTQHINNLLTDREQIIKKNVEINKQIEEELNNFPVEFKIGGNQTFKGTYKGLLEKYNNLQEEYETLLGKSNPNANEVKAKAEELEMYSRQLIKFDNEFTNSKFKKTREMQDGLEKDLYTYNLVKKQSFIESMKHIEKEVGTSKGLFTSRKEATELKHLPFGIPLGNSQNNNNNSNNLGKEEKGLFFNYENMSIDAKDGVGTFGKVLFTTASKKLLQDGSNPLQAIFATATGYDKLIEGNDSDDITFYSDVTIKNGQPYLVLTAKNEETKGTAKVEIPYNIKGNGDIVIAETHKGQFEAWNTIKDSANPKTEDLVKEFEGKMRGIATLANNEFFKRKSQGIEASTVEEKIAKTLFHRNNFDLFNTNMNITATISDNDGNSLPIDRRMLSRSDFFSKDLEVFLDKYVAEKYKITYTIKDKDNNDIMTISAFTDKNDILKKSKDSRTGDEYKQYGSGIFSFEKIYDKIDKAEITTNFKNANKFFERYNSKK